MAKKTFAAVAEDMARKLKSYEKKLADAQARGDKVGEQDYTRRIQRLQQGMNDLFNAQEMSKGQPPSPPMANQQSAGQLPMYGPGGLTQQSYAQYKFLNSMLPQERTAEDNQLLAQLQGDVDAAMQLGWNPDFGFNPDGSLGGRPMPSAEAVTDAPAPPPYTGPSITPQGALDRIENRVEQERYGQATGRPGGTANMDAVAPYAPTMSFPAGPDGTVNMNAVAPYLPDNYGGGYNPPTEQEQFVSGLAEQVANSGYWDGISTARPASEPVATMPEYGGMPAMTGTAPQQPDFQTFESLDPNQTTVDDLTPPANTASTTSTTTEPTPQEEARRVFTPIQSIPTRGPAQVPLVSPGQQQRANESTPAQEAFDFIPDSQGDPSMGMAFTNRPMFTSTTPGTQATTAATAESPAQETFDFIPDETDPSMGMGFTNQPTNQGTTPPTRSTTDATGTTTGGTTTGTTTGGTVTGDATGGAMGGAGDPSGLGSLFNTLNPEQNKFAQFGQFLPDAYAMYQMSQTEKPVNLPEMQLARQNTDLNYNPIYAEVQNNLANTLSRIDRDVSDPAARAALSRSAVNEANQRMGAGQVQEINTETGMQNEYAQRIAENVNQNELIRSQNEQRQIDFVNERRAAQARLAQQAGLKFAQIHGENQNRELERQRMGLSALAFDGQIMQNMAKNLEMMKALGLMS